MRTSIKKAFSDPPVIKLETRLFTARINLDVSSHRIIAAC